MESGRRKLRDLLRASGISARQCRARCGDIDLQRKIRNRRFDLGRSGIFPVSGRPAIETRHVQSGSQRDISLEKISCCLPAVAGSARELRCVVASLVAGCHFKKRREDARALREPAQNRKQRSTISHPNPSRSLLGKNPCGACDPWFKNGKKACQIFAHPIKPWATTPQNWQEC